MENKATIIKRDYGFEVEFQAAKIVGDVIHGRSETKFMTLDLKREVTMPRYLKHVIAISDLSEPEIMCLLKVCAYSLKKLNVIEKRINQLTQYNDH